MLLLLYTALLCHVNADSISFVVPESVPIGHVIGYVAGHPTLATHPKYFVVFPDTFSEQVIKIDDKSGEIVLLAPFDYEKRHRFEILAVPIDGGDGIQVTIDVEDINDHTPTFPDDRIKLEISEFARIGAVYPLPRAEDTDGANYTVQKYRIAQGNVNNVFKISARPVNGELYADLVVNGQLDREYRDKYELIVEAIDGGKPPKIGRLLVHIFILDANDNAPVFVQPRYSITVPANLTIGSQLLTVKATDADVDNNGRVGYRFQKTRFDTLSLFSLSSNGVLSTAGHLLPGVVHDLVVVAYDGGTPSLETTTIVTVTVQGTSLTAPAIDIIWLTDSSMAHILENITLGTIVARLSLNHEQKDSVVSLSGCPSLCLRQSQSPSVYLLLACGLFDRETSPEYHLKFSLRRGSELVLDHPVLLTIGDINDNSPSWSQSHMHITVNRSVSESDQTTVLTATDPDQGVNGRVRYSILDSDVMAIDPDTGRLSPLRELDCSLGSEIRFKVRATDGGTPSLYSDLQVTADLVDGYGRPPQFEKSLYEVQIAEDSEIGTCLLKVKATNSLCGGSSRLRYAAQDAGEVAKIFNVESMTGTICLEKKLDYEKNVNHQLTIAAIDQNGSTGTCLVSVRVLDVNDNLPVFHPTHYNVTVREGFQSAAGNPLLVVSATDDDDGIFGEVHFFLKSGNPSVYKVDETTGEIFLKKPLSQGQHEITVQAKDGNGAESEEPAHIHIYVIASDAMAPSFTQSSYLIKTPEDILPGISIGSVLATGPGIIRYSIYSGDLDHQFMIHPDTGRITVARYLDADKIDRVVLNVKAELMGGSSNHTQVVILIEDHNDNPPKFPMDMLEITVSENQKPHEPFYIVYATDKDKKKNGAVVYSILSSHPPCPVMVQPLTGQLQLTEPLDFEKIKDYRIRVKAQDQGIPPRSANMTLILHVSDYNDNAPVFENATYEVQVPENSPLMTAVLKVKARDADSRENGNVLYRITNGSSAFGIDGKSGVIYTNESIDREVQSVYTITVTAQDQGEPSLSTSTVVHIHIADVNDNAPSCTSVASMLVPFESPPLTTVGTVVISDPDNGSNGTVVYRSQQSHPLFVVKSNGDVHLRRALTDSDPTDVRLSIIASDQGVPRKSTVCHVQIKIGRGTSTVKIVEPFERNIRVPDGCLTSGCTLRQLNATGVVKWQIQSNDVSNHFAITDGKLSMVSPPTQPPPWPLSLILSDKDGRQKHVSIRILESNAIAPADPIKLSPLLPIGSKIANLAPKISSKSDRPYFYTLKNETDLLELDQSTGEIYLIRKIRDLAGQQLSIYYNQINRSTYESEEKLIEFEIGNGSVDAPYFEQEIVRVTVAEDAVIGTIVTTANATTSAQSALPTYQLMEPSRQFIIDQYSGEITVVDSLDWKEAPHHLIVVATVGSQKTSQLIVVDVEDKNNNHPEIISPAEVMVFTEPANRIIHHVVATDDDYGKNAAISYDVISDPTECFGIDSKTGALTMHRRPQSSDSTIIVRATDQGSPSLFADQSITIRLTSGSRKWNYFDEDEVEVTISNTAPPGTTIAALSLDGKAAIRLFPSTPTFEIDNSGKISLANTINAGVHRLSVIAKSDHGEIDSLSIVVRVIEKDQTTLRISSASCGSIAVPENRPLKNFKQIVALNASNSTKFGIRGSNRFFRINPSTGKLSSPALDREQHSEHLLVIVAQDGEINDSCTVRITVSDVNDNIPQFAASTSQVISINDTVSSGDVVYKFTAFDHDVGANGRVFFDLVEDLSTAFDLLPETGELIFVREPIGVGKDWMVRVRVQDKGVPSLGVDWLFRVQNSRSAHPPQPDAQPSFLRQKYVASIDEGLTRGQLVSRVATSSRDSRITYSIVEGNYDAAFEIDGDGTIRTAQELDFEIKEHYDLKIIATGSFASQIETHLSVDVNNINDNPPALPRQQKKKVLETLPIGSYVTTVTSTDADNLAALEYSLDAKEERFVIDRFTGVVHLITSLDYETVNEINVDVKVTDGNYTATTSFLVAVMDVNDNAPEFQQGIVDIKIPQSTKVDDVLAKLIAFDRDSGENGRVSYSLAESYGVFQLDSNDGTLTLLQPLTKQAEFLLSITASDHGSPVLSSTIPVRITVTKEEAQQRPQFPHSNYDFVVSESLPLHITFGDVSVGQLPFFYRVMDAKTSDVFDIDQLGRLSLKAPLDRETKDLYTFSIDVAAQPLVYHQNSTVIVTIRVSDVNDNSPVFAQSEYSVTVRDGMRSGELLQRLVATDADSGDNGRISYRILSGDDYGIFSMGSESGALMFNQWDDEQLTRHVDGRWTIYVEAKDHGSFPRATLIPVKVSIVLQSWSGSAPFFVLPSFLVLVSESTPPESHIFTARATNRFGIPMKSVRYQLKDNDEKFAIQPTNGSIRLREQLDYETKENYKMSLQASDGNGRSAVVSLEIVVLPVDEFAPVFSRSSYTFQVSLDADPGATIGNVLAVDADDGIHGVPEYRIEPPSELVTVDRLSGVPNQMAVGIIR
ncbi:hypothetical protein V3C99_002216 [Haemonchus contortus]